MAQSPVERTRNVLKHYGISSWKAEFFNQFMKIRQDMFGFIDYVALYPDSICGLQICGKDFAEHDRKILANKYAPKWIESGGTIELWAWRKLKGGWDVKIRPYDLSDFKTIN